MRTPDFLRASALRAAVGIAAATGIATTLIFGFVYYQITSADEASVRSILGDELNKAVAYSEADLKRALDLRLTRDLRRLDYVALFDGNGKVVIGNVATMPAIKIDGRPHYVAAVRPPNGDAENEPAIFVARERADGGVLMLGRSLVEVYQLRRTVLWALASASLPSFALALFIGGIFARRTSLRLQRIHDTIERIVRGDLQARLPERKSMDDIDRVSRDVNAMLDEIARLVSQIRSVADNIAHELRTPLSVIRAKLERGVNEPEEVALRLAVNQTLTELDRALVTITALLRMAEIENAHRTETFGPIDLASICLDLFEFYEHL